MDVITKYYNLNRILFLGIGLWPYQKGLLNKVHTVCFYIIFAPALVFQLTSFITHEFSVPLLLEILSTLFICIIYLFKYNTIHLNMEKIKIFLEQIKCDWGALNDSVEIEIMKRQANIARWYTKYFTMIMYIIQFVFVMTHYVPLILDTVIPLAEPRPRRILAVVEVFVDQQRYFHALMLNIMVISFLGVSAVTAAETMLMTLIQHVCGLLNVTSYRIKRTFDKDSRFVVPNSGRKCTVCTKLAHAMMTHKSAIMFADSIKDCFMVSYLIMNVFGVASLSINLYRVSDNRYFSSLEAGKILIFTLMLSNVLFLYRGLEAKQNQPVVNNQNHVNKIKPE